MDNDILPPHGKTTGNGLVETTTVKIYMDDAFVISRDIDWKNKKLMFSVMWNALNQLIKSVKLFMELKLFMEFCLWFFGIMQNKHACLLGNSEMLSINKHTLLSFNDLEVAIVPTIPVYRNASYFNLILFWGSDSMIKFWHLALSCSSA